MTLFEGMPEYHGLRLILGISQLAVVWIIMRRDVGYVWWFGVLLYVQAALNISPAYQHDEMWKHSVKVPGMIVSLVLMAAASLEVFAFLRRRTYPQERLAILLGAAVLGGMSILVGVTPVSVSWLPRPENWFQSVEITRQYLLWAIATAYWGCWLYVNRKQRPVEVELQVAIHATVWGWWLISVAVFSTTAKGGWLWLFVPWKGNAIYWRVVSDTMMVLQLGLMAMFALNLNRWRGGTPAD